ncbi:minor capsid protein [Peptococcus simiae]|uniref:Minor capsid protein n=1 Tax=Peptococcus simiae TaxID=1643805 RepID=A0ABW9GYF3_9FIRM
MSDRTFARRARQAGALTGQMERELDNASRRVRISRLQAAKDTLRREMQLFYSSYDQDLADHLKKQYSDTYQATLTGLKDTAFITMPHIDMTVSRLDAAIRKPWAVDGLTFSQRLWKDQATLVNTLHQTLSRQVALSLPPDETVKALVTAFPEKTMRSAIGRLVMTESNAIATAGTQEAYKATGVKQYEIVATLDSKTSTICQEMDGKRFPTSKMEIGATAPPFHPWCRTTTAPYDPDFDDLLPDGPRAAREADGKTYLTNARTYKEWVAEGQEEPAQNYKPLIFGDKPQAYKRGQVSIQVLPLLGRQNTILVSDRVKLTRKEAHFVDMQLTEAYALLGDIQDYSKPAVVIVDTAEMQTGALASYNAVENKIYLLHAATQRKRLLELQKDLSEAGNELSTYVHELLHWLDAQRYTAKHGVITRENYRQYIKRLKRDNKHQLDKLGINANNSGKISSYAGFSFKNGDYDEVFAEYRTKKILG